MKKKNIYRISCLTLFFLLSWSWLGFGWGLLSLPLFFVAERLVFNAVKNGGIIGVGK